MAHQAHHTHQRSISEPFPVAQMTNQEPPPPLPQGKQDSQQVADPADIGNAQKRPSSAFAKKTDAEKKKPFKCDRPQCGMAFSRQEHLLRHIRKHTGEKPFVCRVCGNSFSRLDNLRQHSQCHERKRRIRNSRRITNVRTEDVQPTEQQPPVYPTPVQQAQILSPMPVSTQPVPAIQEVRPLRRRPDPIVLPHENQFGHQEMVTPPESPASQFGNAPPSPFSPYANSISSIASTPTTGSFMLPSPDNRSGYNTPYNRYSWSFLDQVSLPFNGSAAEARTPKNSRRQTLMAPPSVAGSMFSETNSEASQPPTPREAPSCPTGLTSPRGEGSWFGSSRPKTWHGGPPMSVPGLPGLPEMPGEQQQQRQVVLPPVPQVPVMRRGDVVIGRKRNSQVFDGDGINKATLEPDIMQSSRSEADEQAVRALGFSLSVLQPGNRSSLTGLTQPGNRSSFNLADSTPITRRYSNQFANGNVPNFGNGVPPPVSEGTTLPRYYTSNGDGPSAVRPRYSQPDSGRQSRRVSAIYGDMLVTPGQTEMVPRSIAEEGTRTPGLGGLCALVSAVELQNRDS